MVNSLLNVMDYNSPMKSHLKVWLTLKKIIKGLFKWWYVDLVKTAYGSWPVVCSIPIKQA